MNRHPITFFVEECRIYYSSEGDATIQLVTKDPTAIPLTKRGTSDDRLVLMTGSDRQAAKNYVKNYLNIPDELITEYGHVNLQQI